MSTVKPVLLAMMLVATAVAAAASAFAQDIVPADRPPDFVPFGAYLSWERPPSCAKYYGIDVWEDVNRRLDALQANHVNLLWVTNMSEADLPRLMAECEKRGMRLVPSMGSVEAKVDWRWTPDTYYDNLLPSLVKTAGDSKTLLGWVLSDEPTEKHYPRLETLRVKLRALDPNRFCTSVLMWPDAPRISAVAKLPVVCVDLYPFFGPNDPNGPHTDDTSKSFFRRNALEMMKSLDDQTQVGWVMGMCFSDIWGPREFNKEGHLVGLPGSYLHWRAPTLAEMRWQVWETFRSGAKGFVCYTLAPEAPDPATATLPPADVEWKDVLAKEPADLGPNALTNPDASATPQLEELGRAFALLTPHSALIRRWVKRDDPAIEVDPNAPTQTFTDPDTGNTYAVVLNDDLHEAHDVTIRLGESIAALTDIARGQDVAIKPDPASGKLTASLHLDAGEGTILQLQKAVTKK